MDEVILDSDTLSEVLKGKHAVVARRAGEYLSIHARLAFSAFTYYELLRGIKAKQALRQLMVLEQVVSSADMFPVTVPILIRAADLWSAATAGGFPRTDADLVIAATALEIDRTLVTGNTAHFVWIPGLRLADWRQQQSVDKAR